MSISPFKRRALRLLLVMLLFLTCLGMAGLQLWRAATRGERFEREQAALISTPISISAQHAERDEISIGRRRCAAAGCQGRRCFWTTRSIAVTPATMSSRPLQLSGSEVVVLINRGWIAAPRLRSEIPLVSSPTGEIEISGVTRGFATRTFELQKTFPQGPVWQHVREADYRQFSGLDALPVILLQTGAADDGLIRDWGSPDNPATRHYGYAAMWLVFAVMALFYGFLAWRKNDQ
jgi:surfeit locus 1 family protein